MKEILFILCALILDTLIGLVGIFSLWVKPKTLNKIVEGLVSFAAGSLLGGAFFHLLPKAIERLNIKVVSELLLVGFILFFILESIFHSHLCRRKEAPFTYVILVGDAIHNFTDGLIIAATFFIDIKLGFLATFAIMAHEIPQELGIFGSLIFGKYEKNKAMLYSVIAQSTVVAGGLVGAFLHGSIKFSEYLLPFAAGNFIYIAASDLVPELHKLRVHYKKFVTILFWMILGIFILWIL